ncbi:MAG: hypothetical protein C4533_08190 [Candidatus Omnitrophota bacterium]|jgi:hypothetical protein|nr:MAG: hypothetical protein C4533_08190 [Candidatus Omnitrophota bacterium]
MFSVFHENKFKSKKGQVLPIFIILTVVILILSLISVNIGKVALVRTDTSNAVDAGSLAGGSAMASVFNNVAISNSYMIVAYEEFFLTSSIQIAIATGILTTAMVETIIGLIKGGAAEAAGIAAEALGLPSNCNCFGEALLSLASTFDGFATGLAVTAGIMTMNAAGVMTWFTRTIYSLIVSVTAFYIAQKFFFMEIRRQAQAGRRDALKLGYKFAFKNSGISSKLRSENPLEESFRGMLSSLLSFGSLFNFGNVNDLLNFDFTDLDLSTFSFANSRMTFSLFLSSLQHSYLYIYPWTDRQLRGHLVAVAQYTQDVNKYKLRVTKMPFAAEIGILSGIVALSFAIKAALLAAMASYETSSLFYGTASTFFAVAAGCAAMICVPITAPAGLACCIPNATAGSLDNAGALVDNALGLVSNTTALIEEIATFPLLVAAETGLTTGSTVMSPASGQIIAWIDDIVHNRMLYMASLQHHEGAELGIWRTRYPNMFSYSMVNFNGNGEIYYPNPNFDASIILVDPLPAGGISVPDINSQCAIAAGQVESIRDEKESLLQLADDLENVTIPALQEQIDNFGSSGAELDLEELQQMLAEYQYDVTEYRYQAFELQNEIDVIVANNPQCSF